MKKIAFILGLPILLINCSNEVDSLNETNLSSENKGGPQITNKNERIPVYRFYNGRNHFYSTNYNEGVNNGYSYEGILGYSAMGGSGIPVAVRRFYYAAKNDHFYTLSNPAVDTNNPFNVNWYFAANMFLAYSPSDNGMKIYQYFNPSKVDHFYTSNYGELGAGGQGYNYEGVAFRLDQ